MSKLTFQVPDDVGHTLDRHPEIPWDSIVSEALWQYAKKLELLDRLASESKLTANDVQDLDRIIKQDLTKKYPIS
jgi:hypothetical protein